MFSMNIGQPQSAQMPMIGLHTGFGASAQMTMLTQMMQIMMGLMQMMFAMQSPMSSGSPGFGAAGGSGARVVKRRDNGVSEANKWPL